MGIAITFAKMNVSQLSERQREIFDKFLIKISDCRSDAKPQDDSTFLRWLVARNFDEDEAEKMLRNSLEWRKKNQIDDILDNWQVPEVLEKYYSMGVCGNDKYGCPLWISACRQVQELPGLLHAGVQGRGLHVPHEGSRSQHPSWCCRCRCP